MKQILAIKDGDQFIFNQVGEDKWIETYAKRFENGDGDIEWSICHTTKYLFTSDVERFEEKLGEVGFTIIK